MRLVTEWLRRWVARPLDRLLLHPWVSRFGNGTFLIGVLFFVGGRFVMFAGCDPLTMAGVVLMAVGIIGGFLHSPTPQSVTANGNHREESADGGDALEPPLDSRQKHRFALAGEAEQLAADLIGHCEYWKARYSRVLRPPDAPIDETDEAIGDMLHDYHSKYRMKTMAVFDRLVEEGVADAEHRPSIKRPEHPGIIESISDLLDEGAERLRASDKNLADWLGKRESEIRVLQRQLGDVLAQPHFDGRRATRLYETFGQVNFDITHKLRLEAVDFAEQFERNPEWFDEAPIPISASQFREIVRLMSYTADQVAEIRVQVGM